jgi:hypothetical protein
MFLIFKIFPEWVWWLLLLSGLIGLFASYLPQVKTYELVIKSLAYITIATTIFIFGMLYCDNTWKAAAAELEAKVTALAAESKGVNDVLKEKTVTKLQVVRVRGDDVVRYIDREVVKYDATCNIPQSFVDAHNRAAEAPK